MMSLSKEEFLSQWQQLHLDAYHSVNADADQSTEPSIGKTEKYADTLRNVLSHLQFASICNIASPECYSHMFLDHADTYGAIIDSPETQNGLDNFAEQVLAQTEGKLNESQQWKSSLSFDRVCEKPYMKNLLQKCQPKKDYVLPAPLKSNPREPDKIVPPRQPVQNAPPRQLAPPRPPVQVAQPRQQQVSQRKPQMLPPPRQTQSVLQTDTHLQPLFRQKETHQQNSACIPSKSMETGRFQIQNTENRAPPLFAGEQALTADSNGLQNIEAGFGATNAMKDSSGFNRGALFGGQGLTDSGNFWNMNKRIESQHEDTSDTRKNVLYPMSDQGQSRSGSYVARGNRRPQPPTKRQWDGGDDPDDNQASANSAFRTAKQQLIIEDQKKNRGVYSSGYGTNKKSLGTRRGLNSKFVPPVLNRDDDDSGTGDSLARKVTSAVFGNKGSGSSGGGGTNIDEEILLDERLKNLDPKMVELIMNEIMEHGPPVTWEDIAGLDFAKKTIKEIVIWPMLRPDIFTGLRGPPKGLLLFGPPGTGKTLIGKCIASQSKSTFFSISASSLTSKWVGEGEKMVRALFGVARVHQPAVIFIDEIDSLLSQRSDTEHEGSRRIKTEFLVQLDGATTGADDRILVVGATNRPQEIDEAARRRFVKRLYIPLPEAVARKQIVINLMLQQSNDISPENLDQICDHSDGYSGSDMANLCREAALGPIRSMPFGDIENITADQVRPIVFKDFEDAFTQVRASVSQKDLEHYLDWNKQYGSWGIP